MAWHELASQRQADVNSWSSKQRRGLTGVCMLSDLAPCFWHLLQIFRGDFCCQNFQLGCPHTTLSPLGCDVWPPSLKKESSDGKLVLFARHAVVRYWCKPCACFKAQCTVKGETSTCQERIDWTQAWLNSGMSLLVSRCLQWKYAPRCFACDLCSFCSTCAETRLWLQERCLQFGLQPDPGWFEHLQHFWVKTFQCWYGMEGWYDGKLFFDCRFWQVECDVCRACSVQARSTMKRVLRFVAVRHARSFPAWSQAGCRVWCARPWQGGLWLQGYSVRSCGFFWFLDLQ